MPARDGRGERGARERGGKPRTPPAAERARAPSATATGTPRIHPRRERPGRSWRGVGSAQKPRRRERVGGGGERAAATEVVRHLQQDVVVRRRGRSRAPRGLAEKKERRGREGEARRRRRQRAAAAPAGPFRASAAGQSANARSAAAAVHAARYTWAPTPGDEAGGGGRGAGSGGAAPESRSVATSTNGASTIVFQPHRDRIRFQRRPARTSAARAPPPAGSSARPRSIAVTSESDARERRGKPDAEDGRARARSDAR